LTHRVWRDAYDALAASPGLIGGPARFASIVPWSMFRSWCGRSHLNMFRVESLAPGPSPTAGATPSDFAAALLASAASTVGGGGYWADEGTHTQTRHGSAIYLVPSLANHSCDPNVDVLWPRGDGGLVLTARGDVAQGEELTISYLDCSASVEERRDATRRGWGFVCGCARCQEEGGER